MRVKLNGVVMDFPPNAALLDCLERKSIPLDGIAVAINQQVIPRSQWHQTKVNDADEISVFQAIAGG